MPRRKKARKKASKKPTKTTYRVSRKALVRVIHLGAAHHSALAALKRTIKAGGSTKKRKKTGKKSGKRRAKR
jgi:hypothetical protein